MKRLPTAHWSDGLVGWYLRIAATGVIPAKFYLPTLPPLEKRAAATGNLKIEIVSHCWNYSQLLVRQLSSLVLFPPTRAVVTMTVFHSTEDKATLRLLETFETKEVAGVTWNWIALPKEELFRRSIGRNAAALQTEADWVWFTDCDLMFREDCLDSLVEQLQGRRDTLVYPRQEHVTTLLPNEDPILTNDGGYRIADIDADRFEISERGRATGPLQIVHGDVARACGYCDCLAYYQKPAASFQKCYEDRAFRWLLRSEGVSLDVPGVYRIRHVRKGRYTGHPLATRIRSKIRRLTS
jgi:hypothetical protein